MTIALGITVIFLVIGYLEYSVKTFLIHYYSLSFTIEVKTMSFTFRCMNSGILVTVSANGRITAIAKAIDLLHGDRVSSICNEITWIKINGGKYHLQQL